MTGNVLPLAIRREQTAQWIAKFEESIARTTGDDWIAKIQREAMASQVRDLRAELAEIDAEIARGTLP